MSTLTLESIQTAAELPSILGHANPDLIEVTHDFGGAQAQHVAIHHLVQEARAQWGAVSAAMTSQALMQEVNTPTVTPEGAHQMVIRSVGRRLRPSGRIVATVVSQILVRLRRAPIEDREGGDILELSIGRPQLFGCGDAERHALQEATLHHLLRQIEMASVELVQAQRQAPNEAIVWFFPLTVRNELFSQEINRRLMRLFYPKMPSAVSTSLKQAA